MIEPPKNIGDCRNIFIAAGIQEPDMPLDNSLFPNGRRLAEILNELEALRAIVKEFANADTFDEDSGGYCVLCGDYGKHEADCLVARAKELVK